MGYYVTGEGTLTFKDAESMATALHAVKTGMFDSAYMWTHTHAGTYAGGKRESACYAWVSTEEVLKTMTIPQVLEQFSFDVSHMPEDPLTFAVSYDSKMGDENQLFDWLAPYLRDLCVTWRGEDGSLWRWVLDHGTRHEQSGEVVYS